MNKQYHFKTLIGKYHKGECSEEEKIVVESWLASELRKDMPSPSLQEIEAADVRMRQVVDLHTGIKNIAIVPLWPKMIAAAVAIIVIGLGLFFYTNRTSKQADINKTAFDIKPGGNKAFLTLSDGKRITLTDIKNGVITDQSGVKVTKAGDGQLVYTVSNLSDKNNKLKDYNTIETPNGGQYQVTLPDGSKVWLNAASSLKFPSSFSRLVNRRVELLRGEAYFEVAKDKKHPFIVKSSEQEIKVLGTHFNVNTYTDEGKAITSLLEGSVSITHAGKLQILEPGEQAICTGNKMSKIYGDVENAIAWKQGLFKFEDADVKTVFRQIARWYDVEVNYEGYIKQYNFTGEIYRNLNLSETLRVLKFTGLEFKVEGRKITITNQK